ncbi:hypothetical protein D3C87_1940310 [compost metagenome]
MIVSQPMVVKLKAVAGSFSTSSSQPPTRYRQIGNRINIRPTVLMMNWTMSVRVSDHIPPIAE